MPFSEGLQIAYARARAFGAFPNTLDTASPRARTFMPLQDFDIPAPDRVTRSGEAGLRRRSSVDFQGRFHGTLLVAGRCRQSRKTLNA